VNAPAPYRPFGAASQPAQQVSQATTVEQSRAVAEVEAAVIVAQRVPRDIQRAEAELRDACSRLRMAEQAFYQVPSRGTGPSVHLMREAARIWGNIEHGSHELARDDNRGESEVQSFAWDKQTNTRTSRTFIAPHARMKEGRRQALTDLGDITNNNNNAAARAVRECISNVLPRWFTELAQDLCRATLEHGEGKPLPERIEQMVLAFGQIGIAQTQMELKLGRRRGQWDAGDVAQMSIAYTSITRDNIDKTEVFPSVTSVSAADIVAGGEKPRARAKLEAQVVEAAVKADQADGNDTTTPEPRAVEPTPDSDVKMISGRQMGILLNLFASAGEDLGDEAKRSAWLSSAANRPIGKLKELTTDEAADLILMLRQDQEEAAKSKAP
jgi:hypothetical protein